MCPACSLQGAAAITGGITRQTLSMTVIFLETSGNMTYLLPLMLTFGTAKYAGQVIIPGIFDVQMLLKELPFLEASLHSLGLLNYNPVTEVMATPVFMFQQVETVANVFDTLRDNSHNGYPIVDGEGRLQGLILRKTLCSLLELKAFSSPSSGSSGGKVGPDGVETIQLSQTSTVLYESLEKKYPVYPEVQDLALTSDGQSVSQ